MPIPLTLLVVGLLSSIPRLSAARDESYPEHLARVRKAAEGWYGKNVTFLPETTGTGKVFVNSGDEFPSRDVPAKTAARIAFVRAQGHSTWYRLTFVDGTDGWVVGKDLRCSSPSCKPEHPQAFFPFHSARELAPARSTEKPSATALRPGLYFDGSRSMLQVSLAPKKKVAFTFTAEAPNGKLCKFSGAVAARSMKYDSAGCRLTFQYEEDRLSVDKADESCGTPCGYGSLYTGSYYPGPAECHPHAVAARRKSYAALRSAKTAQRGLDDSVRLLMHCETFLDAKDLVGATMDAALFELALERPADCLLRLEPMTKETWFQTTEPDSRPARENIALAAEVRKNLELCRAAKK